MKTWKPVFGIVVLALTLAFGATACNRKGGTPRIDFDEAYKPTINFWKSELEQVRNGESYFDFYSGGDPANQRVYYALYDIDNNGIQELLIKRTADYEEIISDVYSINVRTSEVVHVFELPWSRVGGSEILKSGLIDATADDYGIYKLGDDGISIIKIAYSEPYDYFYC